MRHLEELINRQFHRWNAMAAALAGGTAGSTPVSHAATTPPPLSVAISRQYGAGARSFAHGLSERTGFTIFGRDAIDFVARDLNVQRRIVDSLDERRRSDFELMLESYLHGHEIEMGEYAMALARVIRAMALKGGVILLGRGAPLVLRDSPHCLRMLIVAPQELRVQRVAAYEHCNLQEARRIVQHCDKERDTCLRRLYGAEVNNPLDYDLVINTERIATEQAIEMVLGMLLARGAVLPIAA